MPENVGGHAAPPVRPAVDHPQYRGPLAPISKPDLLQRAARVWNPAKTKSWLDSEIDLVIGERAGYLIYDLSGRRLIDVHLNGGTFNLGHCNPELVGTLQRGAVHVDIGNHHFPSPFRTELAEQLLATCQPNMTYVVFATSGSEAVDIAIKSVRRATGRRVIISADIGYHGHTGLSMSAGRNARMAREFLSDHPTEFRTVPFNDLPAMERELDGGVAGVILETIPATAGFVMPDPGYLRGVKRLCEAHGAMYIADEVQTGLMRTGRMWAIDGQGVQPDVIVSAKGLGGGLYPLGCAILSDASGEWLNELGWGHVSTGGGAELGCLVGLKMLEITLRPEVAANISHLAERFLKGLDELRKTLPGFFVGVRQDGLVMGLEFDSETSGLAAMRSLYARGVWAIRSSFDPSVLQFKPGLLMTAALANELLGLVGVALREAASSLPRPTTS
jgi:acetylornithine/succinyldiaminopimelate/putrescine aminotransferase